MQRDNVGQLQCHLALFHRAKERRRWSVASIPSSGYGTTTPASSNSQCSLNNTDEHSSCSCGHHNHSHSHGYNHSQGSHHSSHNHGHSSSSSLHNKFLHAGISYNLAHHFSSNDSNPYLEEELRVAPPTHFRPRSRSLSSPVRSPAVENTNKQISKNELTLITGNLSSQTLTTVSPGTITFRRRSRSLSSPIRSPGFDNRFVQMSNVYRERFPNALKQMQERLERFIDENPELLPEIASDAISRFVHRQVIEMAKDCLQKSKDDLITSHYFYEMSENLEKLLTECREKSNNAIIHLKKIIKKLLIIISRPARLLECLEFNPEEFYRFLEAAEGQAKIIAGIKTDIPQYIIEKLGLTRDPLNDIAKLGDNLQLEDSEVLGQENKAAKELVKIPNEDDYENIKLISNGAYGAVYLVKHKESGQRFAMKKINKQNLVLRNQVEQAFAERDIMSFTDNPFVVSLFCSFETKRYLCMVMEYVEGGDCATLLKCMGPMPVDLARFYFAETVLAVEYLHSYGIVHRDLKPDNLLITGMGHIKLTDFGLSKIGLMNLATNLYEGFLDKETKQFNDKQVFGTPEYIAPEVILRQGYGKPVDWWSMGVILYEFLIGCVPFFGETPEELFAHVINDEIEWPDEKEWPLPEEAKCMISQFLVQNPIERLGTAGAHEVKEHCFFSGIDWDALLRQKAEFIPQLNDPDDTSYFDTRSDRYNHDLQDSEEFEDTDESSLFSSFSSCSPRYHKVCSRTEQQLAQDSLMKSSSTSSILEDTAKSATSLQRNCLSQFESSSASNLMRALSLNESSQSTADSNLDLRMTEVRSEEQTQTIATPDSSQTESEDYSPVVRRRKTLGAKDLPKFSIEISDIQKEIIKSGDNMTIKTLIREEPEQESNKNLCTPSIREIPPEEQLLVSSNQNELQTLSSNNLNLDNQSRTVIKSASASGLSLLIPKLELLNRRCSGDLPRDHQVSGSPNTSNTFSQSSSNSQNTKNTANSISEQNLSTSYQQKSTRNTRPSLPGVYLLSPSGSSASSRDNSPNRHNKRRSSTQQRPFSGLATPSSAPVCPTSVAHPLENIHPSLLRHSPASLLGQLKPPIILRKSSRGFGFTLKAIRVYFGDTDVYTVQHLVSAIETNSPAFEAGLKTGDLITHINGEAVQGLLHHQVLQLILSGGDKIQIQTMPLELSTIKTGGRKRNPHQSRLAKRSPFTRPPSNTHHRRSGQNFICAANASALIAGSGTNNSGTNSSSPTIGTTVLKRNDSEKRRKSASLLRRLSSKRASAELNHLFISQSNQLLTPSKSYQNLVSPSNGSNIPNVSPSIGGSPINSIASNRQCTPVTPMRSIPQPSFRSHPSFSDSSQSSSPTSPVPNTLSSTNESSTGVYSRPNSLHGLKHKLAQTFRSPRRKSCGHIPLSPLARSGAPNAPTQQLLLSPTRSPSPLASSASYSSNPHPLASHSLVHPLGHAFSQSPRVHALPSCGGPTSLHRSSPTSGRSTCSSSGEFEQLNTPPALMEHPCKGRKYSSACCNCSPLALSSLPPSSGRFQCRSMIHQTDNCLPDGRRSASPNAGHSSMRSQQPHYPGSSLEFGISTIHRSYYSPSTQSSTDSSNDPSERLNLENMPPHQPNEKLNQFKVSLKSSEKSTLPTVNSTGLLPALKVSSSQLSSPSTYSVSNTSPNPSTSGVSNSVEKDSESSCSSTSDCSVRTARLPLSSSTRSLGSLTEQSSKSNSESLSTSTPPRSATTSKKAHLLHQNSQSETTFSRVRKSLGSPINIRKSLFKQTDKRKSGSSRSLKEV